MRPPSLPRGRRGSSSSRMVGTKAALEEIQKGLRVGLPLPTPHPETFNFPPFPSAHFWPQCLPSYLLSHFWSPSQPARASDLFRWPYWVTPPGQEARQCHCRMLSLRGRQASSDCLAILGEQQELTQMPGLCREGLRFCSGNGSLTSPRDAAELSPFIFLDI